MTTILSIHIPKTAGSFFGETLSLSRSQLLFYNYGANSRATRLIYQGNVVEFNSHEERIEFFIDKSNMHHNRMSIMHGHFHGRRFLDELPDAKFLFWLREPAQRLKSHFEFWNRLDYIYAHNPKYYEFKSKRPTFLEFATSKEFTNRQSFFLRDVPSENVLKYGVVEKMRESMMNFTEILGIDPSIINYSYKNANMNKESFLYDIPKDDLEKIIVANKEDYSLYNNVLLGKLPKKL